MTQTITLDRIAALGRRLRAAGLGVSSDSIADMGVAASIVGFSEPAEFYWAMQSVVVNDRSQLPVFDKVFLDFFGLVTEPTHDVTVSQQMSFLSALSAGEEEGGDEIEEEVDLQVGSSGIEKLSHRDFAELIPEQIAQARRLIAGMAWRTPLRNSRRRTKVSRGDRPNLRRTFRKTLGPEGDLIPLEWTALKQYQRPLILIADVSASMESYSEMFLVFAHAARQRFGNIETFVFSTKLSRITDEMQRRSISSAMAGATSTVDDWSGGTKIGEAFQTFNREWSRRVCRGGPYAVILSDGWDCGKAELLEREMSRLSRSMKRVIWLNPLSGREGYAPETRGMKAVLPYIDDFLPAASVYDLQGVVTLLDGLEK